MNTLKVTIATLLTLTLATFLSAQSWSSAPGSWVKVSGTSTLHDWEVRSEAVNGSLEFPHDFFDGGDGAVAARIVIPSASLESHSAKMDRIMRESLMAAKHKEIRYELKSATALAANMVRTRGDLTVAGTTRTIDMDVTVSRPSTNALIATGQVAINMRDYGIDPPRAMLGAIRTGENVTVAFQWQLAVE